MKTIRIYLLLAVSFLAASCYKDLSTEAGEVLPEISIESEEEIINVAYGHDLHLEPVVSQEGSSEGDFEYLWEIDLIAGKKENRIEIGTELALTYKVGNSPTSTPYALTLTVTDVKTGLKKMKMWDVYVSNSLGEGLLVAHTRDGGKTSDLSLCAGKPVTYGYQSETMMVTEDLYSFANGSPIEGRINSLVTSVVTDGAVYNTTRIMIGTDEHIIALNPLDYKESERDATLFNSRESFFSTENMFNWGDYCTSAIIGGVFFTCICNIDRAYTKISIPCERKDVFSSHNISYAKPDQGKVLIFNEDDSKFYFATVLSVMGSMSAIESSLLSCSVKDAKAVTGVSLKESMLGTVLKLSNGKYRLFVFDLTPIIPNVVEYDLSDVKNLDKATAFCSCDNANLFYYATPDKLYSVMLSGGQATGKALSWQPADKNEKITGISQFSQNFFGTCQNSFKDYLFVLPNHRTQLLITTYNETTGEGKVYMRPFSISTGMFTLKDNGSFGGFGEITAITTTAR